MDQPEPDQVEAAELWLDYRRPSRRPLAGPWRRLPMPCKACGVQDDAPYEVLRERDGTNVCLHTACPGDRSTRESVRLPYPCVICGTTEPGAYELKEAEDGRGRQALHLHCALRNANKFEAWARWN
jgi:hypothetical protein